MKTYKNEQYEVYSCDSYERLQVGIHALSVPDGRANFAMDLMKCLIGPACLDTHPGSRTLSPSEISTLACEAASAAFEEFDARGWVVNVPDIATLKDEARENRGKN